MHRRLAEVMHESLMQGRSRQADFVGEFFDAPRVIGLCMQAQLTKDVMALLERSNVGGSNSLVVPGEYLEIVITRA